MKIIKNNIRHNDNFDRNEKKELKILRNNMKKKLKN